MTYQPHPLYAKIFYTSTLALLFFGSILPPLRSFFHPCINLDTTLQPSTLALFGEEVLYVSMSRQAEMLEHMLRRLLTDQCPSRSMVVEQGKWTQSSTRKPPRKAAGKRWKDGQPGTVGLTLRTSTSALTCGKVEGLDVTLDDLAGFADGSW